MTKRKTTQEKAMICNYAINYSVKEASIKYNISTTSIYNWLNYGYGELLKTEKHLSENDLKTGLIQYTSNEPKFTEKVIDNIMWEYNIKNYSYNSIINKINDINEKYKWNLITWIPAHGYETKTNERIPSKFTMIKR